MAESRFEHRTIAANGIELHTVSAGRGPVILFLHGFPEFWYAWRRQLTEFSRDHRAVAVDLRGYNLSSRPAAIEQYEIKHLVADVRGLIDALGAKRVVLVGHDWGGVVAWAFAMAHPERLEKLVIINAPHPAVFTRELRENPAQQAASQYMLMFRAPDAEKRLAENNYALLVAGVLGEGLKRGVFTEADRKAYLEAWARPGALTGGLNYYRAARVGPPAPGEAAAPPAPSLPAAVVKTPTLVIWGEKDTALLPGNLNGLETFAPNLTLRRIPDGSHWVVHEQPQRVNALIREFLAR